MIKLLEGLPSDVVGFEAIGEVHGKDYREVLDPALKKAIEEHGKIKVLYVLGDEFRGYTAAAMLDDAAVGTRDWTHWAKLAVVTDTEWVRGSVHAFAWMLPGRIRIYPVAERAAAEAWLAEA